jgi:hypothetical protein
MKYLFFIIHFKLKQCNKILVKMKNILLNVFLMKMYRRYVSAYKDLRGLILLINLLYLLYVYKIQINFYFKNFHH